MYLVSKLQFDYPFNFPKQMNFFRPIALIGFLFLIISCSKDDPSSPVESTVMPEISIGTIGSISENSATVTIVINDEGDSPITTKGVCWSLTPNPTLNDNSINEGPGGGEFTITLNGLSENTTYYLRAFATNGAGTSYSPEMTLETLDSCSQNFISSQVVLTTQQEVDEFGAMDFCTLESDLFIRNSVDGSDPIVDLTPLSSIEVVQGGLYLNELEALESLTGLENLREVHEAIYVFSTELISNLDPLSNITGDVTEIVVHMNPSLQNIDGLSGITGLIDGGVGDENPQILITFNTQLQNINGLSNITRLGEDDGSTFTLASCPLVNNIDAIAGFNQDIDRIFLSFNSFLSSISGLQGITNCQELYISYNAISDFSPLQNLTTVAQGMEITSTSLQNLDFLQNLTYVGGDLKFAQNAMLHDYCGLQNLVDANGLQGNLITQSNFYNPTYQDLLDGNCEN